MNTLNNLMVHFAGKYTEFPMGSIRLLVDKSDKKEFDKEIFIDIHMDKYPLTDFVSIYSEMSTNLPEEPDEGKADELLISIYEDCYM
ncbi:MAG: hypothetical protein Q8930_11885, partial [Bacillota bacterium]|nr:hypothetical protein [Bacillota bacterium]